MWQHVLAQGQCTPEVFVYCHARPPHQSTLTTRHHAGCKAPEGVGGAGAQAQG